VENEELEKRNNEDKILSIVSQRKENSNYMLKGAKITKDRS
jgi:hypothetical protein